VNPGVLIRKANLIVTLILSSHCLKAYKTSNQTNVYPCIPWAVRPSYRVQGRLSWSWVSVAPRAGSSPSAPDAGSAGHTATPARRYTTQSLIGWLTECVIKHRSIDDHNPFNLFNLTKDYSKNFTARKLRTEEHMAVFVVKSFHIQIYGQFIDPSIGYN